MPAWICWRELHNVSVGAVLEWGPKAVFLLPPLWGWLQHNTCWLNLRCELLMWVLMWAEPHAICCCSHLPFIRFHTGHGMRHLSPRHPLHNCTVSDMQASASVCSCLQGRHGLSLCSPGILTSQHLRRWGFHMHNQGRLPCPCCPCGAPLGRPVCLPGFGGMNCTVCPQGSWSGGGAVATTNCTLCSNGSTTPAAGSTSAQACSRESYLSPLLVHHGCCAPFNAAPQSFAPCGW